MTARTALILAVQFLVVALAAGYGIGRFLTSVPGSSHEGPPPPLTAEEAGIAGRLKQHVEAIAAGERNLAHYGELERAAQYIEARLKDFGHAVGHQTFTVAGRQVRNIDVVHEPSDGNPDPEVIVIGAHYDSAPGTPGANDNASGVAALLELSRQLSDLKEQSRKRVRFVFFVNEEPPYFQTGDMGSRRYARALAARKERVTAMYSLETVGYYSDERGSQRYPPLFGLLLPDRGDFVAFVGTLGSRALVRETVRLFRSYVRFPSIGGVGPGFIPGIAWSDHWSFDQEGFPAVMVTDTAFYRYPHYHRPSDTPDKVDFFRLTHVIRGMEGVIRESAR